MLLGLEIVATAAFVIWKAGFLGGLLADVINPDDSEDE